MTEGATIRVLIVDGHESVRLGLTTALSLAEDVAVVGEASNGREARRRCEELRPDVVLMDVQLPDGDGVDVIRQLSHEFPPVRVVVLTTVPAGELRPRAEAAGAHEFLPKFVALGDLLGVIRSVHTESSDGAGQPSRDPPMRSIE